MEVGQTRIDMCKHTENSLAQLVKSAVTEEEITLDSNGESVAKLIPLKQEDKKKPRRGGQWKGKVKIAENFDELPEFFMEVFHGAQRINPLLDPIFLLEYK